MGTGRRPEDHAHGPGGADGESDPLRRDASAAHVGGGAVADSEEERHVAQGRPALGVFAGQATHRGVVVGEGS